MSSNTAVFFPSFSREDLTPSDIATLERAAWQLEATNALFTGSSLLHIKNGKIPVTRDFTNPRSDPSNIVASESVKYIVNAFPSNLPGTALTSAESISLSIARKVGYVRRHAESIASTCSSNCCTFVSSPGATSGHSSEVSCFEEVYRTFLAPIRHPFAFKGANTPSPILIKSVPDVYKAKGYNVTQKENQAQPHRISHRKAVCYPLGVRPTQVIPVTTVGAFRSRPCVSHFPPPKASALLPSLFDRVNYQDFSFRHFLGSGSQGRVYLAKYYRDLRSPLLAVKVLKKSAERDTECVMQEHEILKRLRGSPFILNLQAAFNDSLNWYLITDYHCGGDLQTALFKQGHFDEDMSRFYATEMALALMFLHSNSIIHRDMKLANVLLRKDGHIVIADFGLVHNFHDGKDYEADAQGLPLATGCCGTRTHMAPEILAGNSYNYSVDWWSFGICLFAMLQGELPWSPDKIGWSGTGPTFQPLSFNRDIFTSAEALGLIHGLLQKLPQFRMGASDLQAHEFFAEIDWDHARKMGLCPPSLPRDDGDMLADQPLPRYLDFLRGATEPLIPDRFPEFYYLSPTLGGDISSPISPFTAEHQPCEVHLPSPMAKPLKNEPNIPALPLEIFVVEPTLWLGDEDDPTSSGVMESVCLQSASPSDQSPVDCNFSIPIGSTYHPAYKINDSTPKNILPGILDWVMSVGRRFLQSLKHCCKTMVLA
ncbi:kinase-like domain-containing protein [Collybia nuda]|uniref:Kinase-like domain-containing protein n=1 Tax=Collybia nuda TaxID=64659 RepID=A0A9P5YG51_9AGAR|nr:kinase-like domain-containing protein [Collybia nuda]